MKRPALLDTLLNVTPALLALLVPIFFLPTATEFFEFNKLALLTVATGVMLLGWVAKMFYDRRVEMTKSPIDFSIVAFYVVVLLATIFSINKVSSIFGAQARWFPSLFGATVLLTFYYVVASNLGGKRAINTVLSALIIGATISSLVALLSYFGVSVGSAPYMQIPNFTLTGSTVTAAALASLASILALSKITSNEGASTKMLFLVTLAINLLALTFLGSLPSWVVFGVGLLVLLVFTPGERVAKNKQYLGLVGILVIAIIGLVAVPVTRDVVINQDYPREINLTPRESWIVASSVIRDFPILGTGPSTFNLNYTRYKPLSANATQYWNVRFDKPYNQVFDMVGSLGVVGIVVVLTFALAVLRYSFRTKRRETDATSAALAAGLISMVVLMVFTYATVASAFLFVLFLALTTVKNRAEVKDGVASVRLSLSSLTGGTALTDSSGKEVFQYIVALPLVALVAFGWFHLYRQIAGEYFMRQAIVALSGNNGSLAYQLQQQAIRANPQRVFYHSAYANTNLALARAIAGSRETITDDERTTIQALIAQSIRSARVVTEVLSPLSAGGWESRAIIYQSLVGVAGDASDWALSSYSTAVQLDPGNPRLRLALGGVYYAVGDFLSAANFFSQAIALKGDYANAHYNFAQALIQLNRPEQALQELERTRNLVVPGSIDHERVTAEIASLGGSIPREDSTPTIEELEGTVEPEPPAEQEPISNVGEEEPVETELEIDEEIPIEIETETQE